MKYHNWHIISLLILLTSGVFAQNTPKVSAKLYPDTIKIGEQATITLKVDVQQGEKVEFPRVGDTLTHAVEVIEVSKVDSVVGQDGTTYLQKIVITAFDSGAYAIPDFKVLTSSEGKTDTLETASLSFYTQNVEVDTSKAIMDIKNVVSVPPPPVDNSWMWWLLLLIPLAVGIYFLLRYLKNRPEKMRPDPVKPKIPAHILALNALEELEAKKLWQKGHYKEYHSRISQIVRKYIEDRFNMHALEQTSGQIVSMMKQSKFTSQGNIEKLSQILYLADMVKFAKSIPVGEENEMSRDNAKSFINNTILVEKEEELKV